MWLLEPGPDGSWASVDYVPGRPDRDGFGLTVTGTGGESGWTPRTTCCPRDDFQRQGGCGRLTTVGRSSGSRSGGGFAALFEALGFQGDVAAGKPGREQSDEWCEDAGLVESEAYGRSTVVARGDVVAAGGR